MADSVGLGAVVSVLWALAAFGPVMAVVRRMRRPAPVHESRPHPTEREARADSSSWQEILGMPAPSDMIGADFMEELREPGPNRLYPRSLARTLVPSEVPDFEPWRNVPDDYNPVGPGREGRDYETFNRAERVRYLVSMFHTHMRWLGEDGYDEMEAFHDEKLEVMRKDCPDIDKLMPTILTALAYRWETRPAVFVAVANAAMNTDYLVDPTVPMNCYQERWVSSVGPLRNYWLTA